MRDEPGRESWAAQAFTDLFGTAEAIPAAPARPAAWLDGITLGPTTSTWMVPLGRVTEGDATDDQ